MSATSLTDDLLTLPESDLAWAAGIVDGEGCIHIVEVTGHDNWTARLHVGNTDRRMTDKLQGMFGGRVTYCRKRPPRRPLYMWAANGELAYIVLMLIYPYLICKQGQADEAIRARLMQKKYPYARRGSLERQYKLDYLEGAYDRLRMLKGSTHVIH